MRQRLVPIVVLALSLASLYYFSRGLEVVHTIGMLASGAVAGAALAALAMQRRNQPRKS